MKILIAGGTGFVGTHLAQSFSSQGNDVYILTRSPEKFTNEEHIYYIKWLSPKSFPENEISQIDVCINLAGTSLNSGRWTKHRKKQILESRMMTTRELIRIMNAMDSTPKTFINASAIGFYGTSLDQIFTEETKVAGDDFLAEVCSVWEKEALAAKDLGVSVVMTRFGIILDRKYGALPKITLPYQMMFGGPLGHGEQWMSWIHIDDVVGAIQHIIQSDSLNGPVNLTAPKPVRNKEFGKTLSQTLNKPHWIKAPAFAIKTALGDMSMLVLQGQYVYPKQLVESQYSFKYPELKMALEDIFQ